MTSDYDGAWKDLLQRRFFELLNAYFPEVGAAIDQNRPPEFLDQELRELKIDEAAVDNRVDFLSRVHLTNGRAKLLYLHLEVQSFRERDFARRLFHCFATLRRACGPEVISLAVLADLDPDWHPDRYHDDYLGCSIDFRFPCCKLLKRAADFEHDPSLAALAAKAQLEALRTAGDMDHRLAVRLRLTRSLYESGYQKHEVIEAYRLIDWMMKLPAPQRLISREQIINWEKELNMPHLSDIEEMAMQEGLQEGRQEGLQDGLRHSILELVRIRFGFADEKLSQYLAETSGPDQLRQVFNLAATAKEWSELERFLKSPMSNDQGEA